MRHCLEKLAPAARELVRLRYFGEHLPEQIAQLRSQSVNAVNVTLSRARVALRKCLESACTRWNRAFDDDERLTLLVNRYLDGQLTPAQKTELEDSLRRSAAAHAQFWDETRLHALLHEVENQAADTAVLVNRPPRSSCSRGSGHGRR